MDCFAPLAMTALRPRVQPRGNADKQQILNRSSWPSPGHPRESGDPSLLYIEGGNF
ncbi:MAG: hypothetical protein OJF48_000288 [Afipia sp.]|nr:MAG: hypothetical protein OJF48_000288 [Afipia sp.]